MHNNTKYRLKHWSGLISQSKKLGSFGANNFDGTSQKEHYVTLQVNWPHNFNINFSLRYEQKAFWIYLASMEF
jgi:hypothetical protein